MAKTKLDGKGVNDADSKSMPGKMVRGAKTKLGRGGKRMSKRGGRK